MLDDQDNAIIDQVARVAIEHPGQHLIAAFDFDGTAIQGNSPVLLVRYLQKRGMLGKRVIGKILAWAAFSLSTKLRRDICDAALKLMKLGARK